MEAKHKTTYTVACIVAVTLLSGCLAGNLPSKAEELPVTAESGSPSAESSSAKAGAAPIVAIVTPPVKPTPKPVSKPPVKPKPPKYMSEKKLLVIGSVERVVVDPPGIKLEARIDTGAETTSLHADPIIRFERDGKRWVRFTIQENAQSEPVVLERRVTRRVRIKRHDADSQRRYVVKLWLQLGEIREKVDVTLTDRSDFEYPLLIGRNWLTDTAVVDVSRRHIIK